MKRLLISAEQIAQRVECLGRYIECDFQRSGLTVIGVLNGATVFVADLIRRISMPLRLDFMGVSSYGSGTTSGELQVYKDLRLDVTGKDVLLVDDILDTGKTLHRLVEMLKERQAGRIRTCVLLDKPARREQEIIADYVGFEIPNAFVYGYGLDFNDGEGRNLKDIWVDDAGVTLTPRFRRNR